MYSARGKSCSEDTREKAAAAALSPRLRHGSHVAPEAADRVLSYCNPRCNVVAVWDVYKLHKRMQRGLSLDFYYNCSVLDFMLYFSQMSATVIISQTGIHTLYRDH